MSSILYEVYSKFTIYMFANHRTIVYYSNFWKTKLRGQLKNQEFRNFLGIWNICYIFWNREFLEYGRKNGGKARQ